LMFCAAFTVFHSKFIINTLYLRQWICQDSHLAVAKSKIYTLF
jgi:hypothetical protein